MNRKKLEKLIGLYPALRLYHSKYKGWFVHLHDSPEEQTYLGTIDEMYVKDIAEKCHQLDPCGPVPSLVRSKL